MTARSHLYRSFSFILSFYVVLIFFSSSIMYWIVSVSEECIFYFSNVFRYVRAKQVSKTNTGHQLQLGHPPNEKNIYEEAKVLVKIEVVFFFVFKPDYMYFPKMLVKVLICAQLIWIYRKIDGQCKKTNMNKHSFVLDQRYCFQEKLLLSEKCPLL